MVLLVGLSNFSFCLCFPQFLLNPRCSSSYQNTMLLHLQCTFIDPWYFWPLIVLSNFFFLICFLLKQLKEDIQVKNNEAQRESRKKEKMERELKMAKNELESKAGELKTKQNQHLKAQEEIAKLELQLKEQRVSCTQFKKERRSRRKGAWKWSEKHTTPSSNKISS